MFFQKLTERIDRFTEKRCRSQSIKSALLLFIFGAFEIIIGSFLFSSSYFGNIAVKIIYAVIYADAFVNLFTTLWTIVRLSKNERYRNIVRSFLCFVLVLYIISYIIFCINIFGK